MKCPVCLEHLPDHEFRRLRGRKRSRLCHVCELEEQLAKARAARQRYHQRQLELCRENRRRWDPTDD